MLDESPCIYIIIAGNRLKYPKIKYTKLNIQIWKCKNIFLNKYKNFKISLFITHYTQIIKYQTLVKK